MAWTLCTSGAAVAHSGLNANAAIAVSGAVLAVWSDECEGALCSITRKDWISAFSGLGSAFKYILSDTAARMIAMNIINYSQFDYSSKAEAQSMLNVHDRIITRNLEVIKDQNNKTLW